MPRRNQRCFTLIEFVIALVLLLALALVILPLMSTGRPKARQATCLSNQKQIGLGFQMYALDCDGVMPPVVGSRKVEATIYPANWLANTVAADGKPVPGLLDDYLKSMARPERCRCPEMPNSARLTYRYNDLVATVQIKDLAAPAFTVLLMDGEDLPVNAGHSGPEDIPAEDCLPSRSGRCINGHGATIRTTVNRHGSGEFAGANYAFTDGHAKWLKVNSVYFPPRGSNDRRHSAGEPDPAQGTKEKGMSYVATFHVR